MLMRMLSIRIDDETREMARQLADAEDRSMSWILRRLVRDAHALQGPEKAPGDARGPGAWDRPAALPGAEAPGSGEW